MHNSVFRSKDWSSGPSKQRKLQSNFCLLTDDCQQTCRFRPNLEGPAARSLSRGRGYVCESDSSSVTYSSFRHSEPELYIQCSQSYCCRLAHSCPLNVALRLQIVSQHHSLQLHTACIVETGWSRGLTWCQGGRLCFLFFFLNFCLLFPKNTRKMCMSLPQMHV